MPFQSLKVIQFFREAQELRAPFEISFPLKSQLGKACLLKVVYDSKRPGRPKESDWIPPAACITAVPVASNPFKALECVSRKEAFSIKSGWCNSSFPGFRCFGRCCMEVQRGVK